MRTETLSGSIETPMPMNPGSTVYPGADLPLSAQAAREISAMFGTIRASIAAKDIVRSKRIRHHRLAARRMVILSIVSTIRSLENHLREADIHTEDFLCAAREELATLKNDLLIRLATRNS